MTASKKLAMVQKRLESLISSPYRHTVTYDELRELLKIIIGREVRP